MSELNIPDSTRVVNLGAGAFLVDRGTFDGEPAVFLKPTPDDGIVDRVGMNGPKDWPLNTLVPNSIVFTITNQLGADVLASKLLGYDAALTIAASKGEIAALTAKLEAAERAWQEMRDSILNERDAIAENGMTNDQINDVLSNIDYHDPFAPGAIAARAADPKEAKRYEV